MDRVAREAGITKMTVYQYFKSKEALLVRCLQWRIARRESALDALEARSPSLVKTVTGLFDWTAENATENAFSGCAFVKAANEVANRHPVIREVALEAKALMHKRCVRLAERMECDDAVDLGHMWAFLLDGAQVLSMVERSALPFGLARKQALSSLRTRTNLEENPRSKNEWSSN